MPPESPTTSHSVLPHPQDPVLCPGGGRNIVVFSAHFAPHMGGVERYTECLWSRMAARGWNVLVVTCNTDHAPAAEEVAGMHVVRLPSWNVIEGRVPLPRCSPQLLRLWTALMTHPPDVVVSNTRFFPTSVLAALVAKATGRPRLHIDHGSAFVSLDRPLLDRATRLYDTLVGGMVLRSADHCCGVSQAVAEFVTGFGVRDCGVLFNGVDPTPPVDGAIDFRSRLQLRDGDVLVSYVGRLIEAKGVRDLLTAFGSLAPDSGVHVAFAGAGPLAAELETLAAASASLHMLGRLTPVEVHSLLRDSDVLVHPSAYPEGLPTVLLEAAAAGVAIIATPMGGSKELVSPGVSGLLVPPSRPEALRDAIEALAGDPALRERLGREALRRVADSFTWDKVADACQDALTGLLAAAHGQMPTA